MSIMLPIALTIGSTQDKWQSKTLLTLATNVDKKSLETVFSIAFVASQATDGN